MQILSIAFELAEYSLQHQLPNFAEVRLHLRERIGTINALVIILTVLVGSCMTFLFGRRDQQLIGLLSGCLTFSSATGWEHIWVGLLVPIS